MELEAAVRLIEKGIDRGSAKQVWADLGAGKGLFTQALAKILPEESIVIAIDKDVEALRSLKIPSKVITLLTHRGDFTKEELGDKKFDGVLMANSLHFVEDKFSFISRIIRSLKDGGRILLIEYDMNAANPWVPWPISFQALKDLASETEFNSVTKLHEHPSIYNRGNMYSAILSKRDRFF
jgi:ubiquinone/menaquinone biosynthesis C-methylase UbiE